MKENSPVYSRTDSEGHTSYFTLDFSPLTDGVWKVIQPEYKPALWHMKRAMTYALRDGSEAKKKFSDFLDSQPAIDAFFSKPVPGYGQKDYFQMISEEIHQESLKPESTKMPLEVPHRESLVFSEDLRETAA